MNVDEGKINQLVFMGIPREKARRALETYSWDVNRAADQVFSGNFDQMHSGTPHDVTPNPIPPDTQIVPHATHHTQVGGHIPPVGGSGGGDSDIEKAIALSLEDQKRKKRQETSNILDLQLDDQTLPRGLKNLGNTCFVNCLMQVYFYLTPIRDRILQIEELDNDLVRLLQELFANLLYTEKRYYDPRTILDLLAKEKILENVGVQEDINEVNGKLLERLEEADEGLKAFLKKHFYGNFVTTIRSEEENKEKIELERSQPFNHLHVNISQSNPSLYQSLNDLTASETHEFTTDNGFKTTAKRITFIQNAPPIILFQLKRSQFSKAVGMTIKINKAYDFPDYIYLDRYLHENRDEILKRREEMDKYKQEIRVLREELKKFEYEGKEGQKMLEDTLKFLSKISRGEGEVQEGLKKIHSEVKTYTNGIKKEMGDNEAKIDSTFLDWKKEKYCLYAIVVHEGTTVDMGHYVTYIKYNDQENDGGKIEEEIEGEGEEEEKKEVDDISKEIEEQEEKKEEIEMVDVKETSMKKDRFNWCKFNDKNVDLMTDENVKENLKIGNRSVYCLIYLQEKFKGTLSPPNKPLRRKKNINNNNKKKMNRVDEIKNKKKKEEEDEEKEEKEEKKGEEEEENISEPTTPITSPTNLASPIDFGINAVLRYKVLTENEEFRKELKHYFEKEKIEIENEKLMFTNKFDEEKNRLKIKYNNKKNSRSGDNNNQRDIYKCYVDSRVANLPYFYTLLLSGPENQIVEFELAKVVYAKVVERKKVNTFEEMLKLIKITKKPDEEAMKIVREERERFMIVTKYLATAISHLNREDYNLQGAFAALRVAIAYDHKIQNPMIKQYDLIVEYFAVCMKILNETGLSLLKDSRNNCVEYFRNYNDWVSVVYDSEKFRLYLENVVAGFFNAIYMNERTHTFNQSDCDMLNEKVIPLFQNLSKPYKKRPIETKKEEPAVVSAIYVNSYGNPANEYRNMTDESLANYMKRIKEQTNKKHYDAVRRFRFPNDMKYQVFRSHMNNRKYYRDYDGYFKVNSRRDDRDHFWRHNWHQ